MRVLYAILLLLAAVCFGIAAFSDRTAVVPGGTRGRINLVACGLLLWVLVPLIETLRALED